MKYHYITLNFWRKRFVALVSLRRDYANWLGLTTDYVRGHSIRRALLREFPALRLPANISVPNLTAIPELFRKGWGAAPLDSSHITLTSPIGLRFVCRIRNANDMRHLVEIFVDDIYHYTLRNKIVLDVGMSNADSSIYFANAGSTLVIGLEPIPDTFELAKRNILLNELGDKIIPIKAALSAASGSVRVRYDRDWPNLASLNPPTADNSGSTEPDRVITVETTTIESIMSRFGIDHVDMIKMDCEGAEYQILRSISKDTMSRISSLTIEFHQGIQDITDILRSNGFDVRIWATYKNIMGYVVASRTTQQKAQVIMARE